MYCNKCGKQLPYDSVFCAGCGTKVSASPNQGTTPPPPNGARHQSGWKGSGGYQAPFQNRGFSNPQNNQTPPPNYTKPSKPQDAGQSNTRLACAFAFIPFLFWVPLVAAKDEELGHHAANQGLILLIITLVRMMCGRIVDLLFDWTHYAGWTWFDFHSLTQMFLSMLLGIVALYVAVCAVIGFIKTLNGERFEIPIFGKLHIIN